MSSTLLYSIGGLLLFGGIAMAVGLFEARAKKRNALGWIVSIGGAIVGGACGLIALTTALGVIDKLVPISESLGRTGLGLDVALGVGAGFGGLVLGAWLALRLVNRYRD